MKRGRYFARGRKSHDHHDSDSRTSSERRHDHSQGSSSGSGRGFRHARGRGGSWMSADRGGGRDRPPPGLRGRDIGLFFRQKALERKEKKEFVMALRLPTGVVKRVERLLHSIHEKRKDELSLEGVFKCPKNYMQKQDPFEDFNGSSMSLPSGSQTGDYHFGSRKDRTVAVQDDSTEGPISSVAPNFIAFNFDDSTGMEDSVHSSGDLIHCTTDGIETADDDCVILEPETPVVQVDDDDISLKNSKENSEIESDSDDCFIYEPPPYKGPRLLPFYTDKTNPDIQKNTFDIHAPVAKREPAPLTVIATPEYIPLSSKTSKRARKSQPLPTFDVVTRENAYNYSQQLLENQVGPRSTLPQPPPKRPTNYSQRWTRLEDINESEHLRVSKIETKEESIISVADLNSAKIYRPLPLRQEGQQYKYGYYDIITGSFIEKLDECMSKGIAINTVSTDLNKLSEDYYNSYIAKTNTTKYKEMLRFRERLPAYKKRKELLDQINSSQVLVISGETGCGKSTQVPQIILDEAIKEKRGANVKIIVTQPRRIAASSLSARVSEERAESQGESVGYVVRLERRDARPRGSITYCTTGVLLADLEVDQALSGVSHVLLDEVHERDCNVDLAMCMLRQVISKRKDLKLILMSATLDAESLSAYFNNCPTMHIEGLAYPVTDYYLEDVLKITGFTLPPAEGKQTKRRHNYMNRKKQNDEAEKEMEYRREMGPILDKNRSKLGEEVYRTLLDRRIEEFNADLIFELISFISRGEPGAILVFVPGLADITKIMGMLEKSNQFPRERYDMYPLHSKLPSLEQKKIFDRPPHGVRKIVVATNIAETSITIDDVVYVIDSGKIKVTGLNVVDNISTLSVEWVSQANLRQRRGRAGRVQPGVCYHLMTSYRAERLATRLLPELQRSSLLEPVLTIKRLRLGRAGDALGLVADPPDPTSVQAAVQHLKRLGALDESETLTPLGWHVARLPVHPAAGKLLLLGALFGCLDRAASVAASWGFKDPFIMVIGKEKEADAAKSRLTMGEPSDHVAISEAIRQWEQLSWGQRRDFAWTNFLSTSNLQLLCEMKKQFAGNLKSMGFLPNGNIKSHWENRNADNLSIFKAVVAAALYPQIGTVKWVGMHRPNHRIIVRTPEEGKVHIHPSSALCSPVWSKFTGGKRICSKPGANWHAYWLKQKTSNIYLFDLTLVHTMPLLFFGELNITDVEKEPRDCHISISSIKVRCEKTTAGLLVQLRNLLDEVLASRVAAPGGAVQHGQFEENVLNAVIELITAEDEQTSYFEGDDDESETSDSTAD